MTPRKLKTLVEDPQRELHRVVVDPGWVKGNVVSTQAFLPRPQDRGSLSLLDKGSTAVQALAWWHHQRPRKHSLCLTVTVAQTQDAGLLVYDDSDIHSLHVCAEADRNSLWDLAAELLARGCTVNGPAGALE